MRLPSPPTDWFPREVDFGFAQGPKNQPRTRMSACTHRLHRADRPLSTSCGPATDQCSIRCLSAKPPPLGHACSVRQLRAVDGNTDTLIAGLGSGHTYTSYALKHVRHYTVVQLLRPIQSGRRCYRRLQLDHLSARSHEFAMLLPEPLLQVRYMPTVGQGWICMLLGACPDAGQRRIDSSQVQRRQPAWHRCAVRAGRRLRAIQRAYPWEGHLRQHAVRGGSHPALAPR